MSLLDNLIAAWEQNEASGNALDSRGTNPLTDNNSVGSGTGVVYALARSFVAASSQYFSHASNGDLQTGDIDFTVEVWVNPASFPTYQFFAGKSNIGVEREWVLLINPDQSNKFDFLVFNGTSAMGDVVWGTAPGSGSWYQVIAWHDSVNNQVGISVNNGTPVTGSTSGPLAASGASLLLGATLNGGSPQFYLDGRMGPGRFWKRLLTSQERTDLYNGGAGLPYSSFGGGNPAGPYYYNQLISGTGPGGGF